MKTRIVFVAIPIALIVCSLSFCIFVAVFDAGLKATPYDMTDSAGRTMGFNDPLSREHYQIAFQNFRFSLLLHYEYMFLWFLLFMHGWGLRQLVEALRSRASCPWKFFAIQALCFPFGWIGFAYLPYVVSRIFEGALDRESVIDVPFIAFTAQTAWLLTSGCIVFIAWLQRNSQRP